MGSRQKRFSILFITLFLIIIYTFFGDKPTFPIQYMKNCTLPVITIDTESNTAIDSNEVSLSATFKLFNANDYYYPTKTSSISIKGRGNSSWTMPKKSYSISFIEPITSLFNLDVESHWALLANYCDKSLLRNWYASYLGHNVFHDESEWQPTYVPVELFINEEYQGVYTLVNKIHIDKDRINIPDILNIHADANHDNMIDMRDGGFILEVNARQQADYTFTTQKGVPFDIFSFNRDDISTNGYNVDDIVRYIEETIQSVENVVYLDSWGKIESVIDVSSFIDWYLINEITKNNDAIFYTSVFMYYNPYDSKIHMGPDWDFDISCGNINYNGCDDFDGFWIKNAQWISALFNHPEFKKLVSQRWNTAIHDLKFSIEKTREYSTELEAAASMNFNKWDILGKYVWPNADGFESRITYESEISYLTSWLTNRIEWLDNQIKIW